MHRELSPELGVAAAQLEQNADLVGRRMRVRGDAPAVDGLEARGADDADGLPERPRELSPLLVETLDRLGSVGLDRVEHLLSERLELVVLRHRLGLAPDGDDRPLLLAVREPVPDETFRRLAARALRRLRHPALA